jgi:CCR4-NOT transcription complex subunit 1
MNLDSLSFALTQISHLVSNLTKKNYKTSQTEITSVSVVDEQAYISCSLS